MTKKMTHYQAEKKIFTDFPSLGKETDYRMKFRITEECVACGACSVRCPPGAITEGDLYKIDPEKCDGCGICAQVCPMDACVDEEEVA